VANKGIDEDGNSFELDDILRVMVLKMPSASFWALAIRNLKGVIHKGAPKVLKLPGVVFYFLFILILLLQPLPPSATPKTDMSGLKRPLDDFSKKKKEVYFVPMLSAPCILSTDRLS
jgi:hypothetical protein